MNNLPHLLFNDHGVVFPLAAFPAAQNPFLCFGSTRVSPSLNSASFLFLPHGQISRKLSPHGEGQTGQRILCSLAREGKNMQASHGRPASLGRHARRSSHGKPASSGHMKVKKTMKSPKEAEIEEALSKLGSPKPSEDCIAHLFEQQPLRLHNNVATFQRAPQEPNTHTHKAGRLDREKVLLYATGSSQVSSLNGDVKLEPDFSRKLLDIVSSFKRDYQLNDVNLTGVVESQPVEKNLGEAAMQNRLGSEMERQVMGDTLTGVTESQPVEKNLGEAAMQRPLQSRGFISSGAQDRLGSELERQVMDETSDKGTQHVFSNEIELSNYSQSEPSREHILDSPWISKNTPEDDQLEESDFSSDDEGCNEVEIMQDVPKTGNASLQHANGISEGKGSLHSDSLSPFSSSRGWSYVSPRHLSRSTGSRSSPSKSSIPGLRSKYSKPDPRAKQQSRLIKSAKPLHLLSNPEMEIEQINRRIDKEEDEKDDVTLTTFPQVHGQAEKKLEECLDFDWWDSDQEDDPEGGLPAGAKLSKGSKIERPSDFMPDSKVETKSRNMSQLKGEAKVHGISRRFESLCEQAETKAEECMSFDQSYSDAEGDLREDENNMFEWSDSDAESNPRAEVESLFEWTDSDAEDDVGTNNDLLSATSQHPISFGLKGHSTSPKEKDTVTSSLGSSSHQDLTFNNQDECQNSGSKTYFDHSSSLVANQSLDHDGFHLLPASVKFLEPPRWKSQIYPEFPFEIQYSYSETPKAPLLGFRNDFSPFGPETMERPWTGGPHIRPRRHLQAIQSFDPAIERKKAFELTFNRKSQARKVEKSREKILGKPLREDEIIYFVQKCHEENRYVNLGRDGLTHNMLHLIHAHWKRRPVCKIKCRGVPTLDMDNLCFHVEDKTGGQIIYRSGGVLYVFRGRNYRYHRRPVIPFMLYRPASPVYPKLVPQAPAGLTIEEAHQLRILGQKVKPLVKLCKNGVHLDLVGDVRDAFKVDDLVSLDYEGLKPGDYRKLGGKLRELVPCVLLSFRNHRIVLWKGRDSRPPSIHNPESCVDNAKLTAEPSLEATDAEGTCISASETKLRGSGDGIPVSQPAVFGEQSVDSNIPPVFKEESTRLHHLDNLNSQCEYNFTDSSIMEPHSQSGVQPHKPGRDLVVEASNPGGKICLKALPEQQLIPLKRDEEGELCADDEGRKDAVFDMSFNDDTPFPAYGSQRDHLNGEHRSDFPFGKLNALWDVALKDGMAVELEGVDLEADLVLQIVSVFSEVAPTGPEYTDKLVNRLRLRGVYEKILKPFVVPLHAKNLLKKKKISKRTSHSPMPPSKALETDDLARILFK